MALMPKLSNSDDSPIVVGDKSDFGTLLHRLNNQLSIILANAELLEGKLGDNENRSRASQIVDSVVDAIGTARDIRAQNDLAKE